MRQLSIADKIWNRAALESGGPAPRKGDRALADLLLAHGMVMNGGFYHAVESLSHSELSAAARGYRFFGLEGIAWLLEGAVGASDEEVDWADILYSELIPNDRTLVERFEAVYRSSPEAFAPLDS